MPRLSKETREKIKGLSQSELSEIVIKSASKEKSIYDFILLNYLDKENAKIELFETTMHDLIKLQMKGYRGRSDEQRAANMLSACIKRVNEFTKISKDKIQEVDLLMYLLKISFSDYHVCFSSYSTAFDYKVSIILKRVITIVTKKMHQDYLSNYQDTLNQYLQKIHKTSNHLDSIYDFPEQIEVSR